jgi:hypothetical protein
VRLELAAASACGKCHAVNEDSYSALDRAWPVYVVADGVGGGAMASWASRELVRKLHGALDRRRIDEGSMSNALLAADRDVAEEIAEHTAASGAATVALCAATHHLLSRWLIAWVGDCRIYRVSPAPDKPAELLTRDDTYAHLPRFRRAGRPTIPREWSQRCRQHRTWEYRSRRRRCWCLQRRFAQACRGRDTIGKARPGPLARCGRLPSSRAYGQQRRCDRSRHPPPCPTRGRES